MRSKSGGVCFSYLESGTCRFGSTCKFAHVEPEENGSESFVQSPQRNDHISDFFAEYPDFDYDESAEIWREFYRMCDEFGWNKRQDEKEEAMENFKSAMVQQFNDLYGTDGDDLNAWQSLCHVLNIVPMPVGLNDCRKVSHDTAPLVRVDSSSFTTSSGFDRRMSILWTLWTLREQESQ
ncbi:hypothetical protein Z517_02474 [Fonsecaea pedrosoi CBS 271.37]|uniref:Unplaced genomic scaffold supercont1.2, whole genome shotgun sequence n=1 Tax=Fonsecaea pedrosoi CBS 271.37 TaxID=1442368 RepID=A0A0D2HFJ0_9EURO|nr:uncharacterized protein Z517_02474 [Fonsecaea pedrosoi CBS 271.37]KIW83229.1 hypothetical protein Z517_02474 [Fonsecaea pedrosoi CBS 271.37]